MVQGGILIRVAMILGIQVEINILVIVEIEGKQQLWSKMHVIDDQDI